MGKIFKCYSELSTPENMVFVGINDVKRITSCVVPDGGSKLFIDYYDDEFCFDTTIICDRIITIDTDVDEDYKIWLKS